MREVLTRFIHFINQQIRTALVDIQSSRHFVATESTVGYQEHLERIGVIAENMKTRTPQKDEGLFLCQRTNDKLLVIVFAADDIDVKKENETLWKYFGLKKENPSYEVTPANVIRRDVNDDFYSFTLDAGTAVGVHVNAPVVTEKGLVGWVYQADAVSCKVKTILSPDTKAGVSDKLSGDSGILSGSVSLCDKNLTSMNKLVENHTVKEGDMIVTSGTGGVYPSGLLIGEVQSIEFNKYDASRYAIIKPYEDVRKITSAAVITDFDDKGKVVKSDEKKN